MGLTANDLMAGQWGKFDGIFLSDEEFQQDDREAQLIYHFRTLNDNGQTVAVERVQELTQIPAYQRRADTAQSVPGGADDKEPAEK